MRKQETHRLGDLQLKIMKVLWQREEVTVGDVFAEVCRERDLAYTTIATMLRKMEARGLLAHRVEGRTFIYRAAVDYGTRIAKGLIIDLEAEMAQRGAGRPSTAGASVGSDRQAAPSLQLS